MSQEGRILVLGEALIDIVVAADGTSTSYVGGSAANVAVALARLGVGVELGTSFADDEYGDRIGAHLEAEGVRLAVDARRLERTSTAVARLGADGSASYAFEIDWRLGVPDLSRMPAALHVCSIGALIDPGAEVVSDVVERCAQATTITYDINLRSAVTGTGPRVAEQIERLVARCTIVKASDEDLTDLRPDRTVEESALALLANGPAAVVVTRGADGASVWTSQGRVDVASPPAVVVDTIGAGDTFMAGLITALGDRDFLGATGPTRIAALDANSWERILGFAAAAAAVTVSRSGANPPRRAELEV